MTSNHWHRNPVKTTILFCGGLLLPFYLIPQEWLSDAIGQQPVNIFASLVGAIYGLAILRRIWEIEKYQGRGTIPFAWCYFSIQHVAFGLAPLVLSVFDNSYIYHNAQGSFEYAAGVLPLLKVHLASMTVGLFGVWFGICGFSRRKARRSGRFQITQYRWSWQQLRVPCLTLLVLHAILDVLASIIKLPEALKYPVLAVSGPPNAGPLLWGLCWQDCSKKWVFVTYYSAYGLLEVIRGDRTAFVVAAVLFVLGYIISGRALNIKLGTYLKLAALGTLVAWAFVTSEDIRTFYSRGTPDSTVDAEQRIESIGGDNFNAIPHDDAGGQVMNPPFRIASRVFETSALDVVARTPDVVPFWGWEEEDTTVLLGSILPLGLNDKSAFYGSERNGVFFLRTYGWYVDPFGEENAKATSMPATLVADSWRRFGWIGVVVFFFLLGLLMARFTIMFRFHPRQIGMAVFCAAVVGELVLWYTQDMVYFATSLPRRLAVMAIYGWAFSAAMTAARKPTDLHLAPANLREPAAI